MTVKNGKWNFLQFSNPNYTLLIVNQAKHMTTIFYIYGLSRCFVFFSSLSFFFIYARSKNNLNWINSSSRRNILVSLYKLKLKYTKFIKMRFNGLNNNITGCISNKQLCNSTILETNTLFVIQGKKCLKALSSIVLRYLLLVNKNFKLPFLQN